MLRIPSLTSLRDSALVLTAAAMTVLALVADLVDYQAADSVGTGPSA